MQSNPFISINYSSQTNGKMHIGPLNTVQYTVIYKLTNNKGKVPASEFRMSQIMFSVFHREKK